MHRGFLRVVCVIAATVGASAGVLVHEALTEMASAAPPPVVNTDYANYPFAGSVPAGCTGGNGGPGVLVGYRSFIDPAGVAPARIAANPTFFADPGVFHEPRNIKAPVSDTSRIARPNRFAAT
jgi:hypothetical protein